jgi:hypothetical protein
MEMDSDVSNPFIWPEGREMKVQILEPTTSDYEINIVNEVSTSLPARNSNVLENLSARNVLRQVSKTTREQVQQNSEQRIPPAPFFKLIPATVITITLIVIPLLSVFAPGWIYTSDLSKVFLFQTCSDWSTQTVFLFCFLRIVICSVLLRHFIVPAIFGCALWNTWATIHKLRLKRRKIISLCVKIIIKASCFFQLIILVAPQLSFDEGLFHQYNVINSTIDVKENGAAMTCKDAEMSMESVIAMRAWYFVRIDFIALLAWELAFVPELHWSEWSHHLLAILCVGFILEPGITQKNATILPILELYGFGVFLQGPSGFSWDICIFMYHFNSKKPSRQVMWMKLSTVLQFVGVLVSNMIFPAITMAKNFAKFGAIVAGGILFLTLFSIVVEFGILSIKISVVRRAKKKVTDKNIKALHRVNSML